MPDADKKEIIQHFDSYEDAAEFWETHDTVDFLDEFDDIEVKAEFKNRFFEVELEEVVVLALQKRARREGVSTKKLVSKMLRKELGIPAH